MASSSAPDDDGQNAGRLEMLLDTVRWLASEPDAALGLAEQPLGGRQPDLESTERELRAREQWALAVPDEIALDLEHWLAVARGWELVSGEALDLLNEIDAKFSAMSGQENAELWTPDALRSNPEWAAQRDRARRVLALMDDDGSAYRLPAFGLYSPQEHH